METVRCLSVPGPVSSGQFLVENTCPGPETDSRDITSRQDCHQGTIGELEWLLNINVVNVLW